MKPDMRPLIAAILPAAFAATTLWYGFGVAADAYAQDTRQHVVEAGDTLFGIARTYGVTVESLRRVNRLSGDDIRVGQLLIVPESENEVNAEPSAARDSTRPPGRAVESAIENNIVVPVHGDDSTGLEEMVTTDDSVAAEADSVAMEFVTVQADRSLYDVAFAVGLDVDSLIALNPDLPRFLDSTRIAVPGGGQAAVSYRVKTGDTLYKIATEHGTTIEAIRKENLLSGDAIRVDQVLVIPSGRGGRAVVSREAPLVATGFVRPYPSRFEGRLMASGRAYEPGRFYVSHADLPFGSVVLLTSPENGANAFAEVVDRLPSNADYAMDVSLAVAMALDVGGKSNPEVEIRVVRFGSGK